MRNIVREAAAVVGLGMVFYGCWQLMPAVAWIVVGALLLGAATWGHFHAAE